MLAWATTLVQDGLILLAVAERTSGSKASSWTRFKDRSTEATLATLPTRPHRDSGRLESSTQAMVVHLALPSS